MKKLLLYSQQISFLDSLSDHHADNYDACDESQVDQHIHVIFN
jgi:hypothetical protein